jgi:uncharacterized membrane protein YdbT with pleckstrin-like domain
VRVVWPSVTRFPFLASLGRLLLKPVVTAPLAALVLAPAYFSKILPGLATRYTLTNRGLRIERGLLPRVVRQVDLADIDEVLVRSDANSACFRSATLEIVSRGEIKLILPGVPDAEAFKQAILNACMAWVPGRAAAWIRFTPARPPATKQTETT